MHYNINEQIINGNFKYLGFYVNANLQNNMYLYSIGRVNIFEL